MNKSVVSYDTVNTFIPQTAVKTLDVFILPEASWIHVNGLDVSLLEPFLQFAGDNSDFHFGLRLPAQNGLKFRQIRGNVMSQTDLESAQRI